jgi:hypothetical protein
MQKNLTLTCAALLVAMPSFAFAQTSGAGMGNAPSTSVPSAEQPKTPGVGTSSNQGRSSSTMPPSDPNKPDTDGLHPSGPKLDKMDK